MKIQQMTCAIAEGDLPDDVHRLLIEAYKTKVPRFQELCKIYEEDLKWASNKRRKSTFPTFNEWIPTGLFVGDQELLQGPSKHATMHKKITIEDENTNHLVTFTAADHESTTSRYSCSYARVLSDTSSKIRSNQNVLFAYICHTSCVKYFQNPSAWLEVRFVVGTIRNINGHKLIVELASLSTPLWPKMMENYGFWPYNFFVLSLHTE